MKISTLKKALCTLSMGLLLMLGVSIQAQAQRRYQRAYGRRDARPYGQLVSARRHYRNAVRHDLMLRQRNERRIFNSRLRYQRGAYGNNPTWRYQRKQERQDFRIRQRQQREDFRDRFRNNGRGRH